MALTQVKVKRDNSTNLSDANIEMLKRLSSSIRRFYQGWKVTNDLINYEKELRDLAYKWHLKIKQSGIALILSHIYDIVGIMSEGNETIIEIPAEVIEPILDKTMVPPLIFKITAYELMYNDQRETVQQFAKKLSDYEKEAKSLGWEELPNAVKTHAFWWFEHYVHGKPYNEIAAENSVEVDENSVRQAVFHFRKLLRIKIN